MKKQVNQIKKMRWKRKLRRYRQMFQIYAVYILSSILFLIVLPIIMYSQFGFRMLFLFGVFSFISLFYLAFTKKTIMDKFGWFILILALPFFGAFLFYLIGITQLKPKAFSEKVISDLNYRQQLAPYISKQVKQEQLKMMPPSQYSSYTTENEIIPLTGETVFRQLLEDLKKAREFIYIEIYISRFDDVTLPLFEVLKQKASEGVDVKFLGDVVGHILLRDKVIQSLISAGVDFTFFGQTKGKYFDHFHVNHRKLILIDGEIGYTGGFNIGREYVHGYPYKNLKWFDIMFRIKGASLKSQELNFLLDWSFSSDKEPKGIAFFEKKIDCSLVECSEIEVNKPFTQVLVDGPDCLLTELKETLRHQIVLAKSHIYITTPYLIPSDDILQDLKLAVHSGVEVKIIIPGTPDKKLVYKCSESYIEALLLAGVKVYKMDGHFIHSKLYIFDQETTIFGTMNLDMRSLYLNFEQAVVQHNDQKFNQELTKIFDRVLVKSTKIELEIWKQRSLIKKTQEILVRILAPLL
ncbi:MAG: cardiolipin synthase [Culicoidibacterales bacterium]